MRKGLDERKLRILRHLLELGEASVAELHRRTGIPRSSLNHHLQMLLKRGCILQRRSGKMLVSRVVPARVQRFRRMLGVEAPVALVSGYTYDPGKPDLRTLKVLERAVRLLEERGVRVTKRVAFTTPLAREKIAGTEYLRGDEEVVLEIGVYQNDMTRVAREMEAVTEKLLPEYEVGVDLTPLTKLFTIAGLRTAARYSLRAMYHAGRELVWVDEWLARSWSEKC